MEKKTGQGADVRHLYKFSIILITPDTFGGAPGDLLEIDTGDRPLGKLECRWNAQGVEVVDSSASRTIARGTIRDGRQYWEDVRQTPSTVPATSSRAGAVLGSTVKRQTPSRSTAFAGCGFRRS